MALPQSVIDQLNSAPPKPIAPKRGDDIFTGTDYPRTWDGFIGQSEAVEQLQCAIRSAVARKTRLDHTIFSSGVPGVGKTTLATLAAAEAGVGFLQTTGPLTAQEFKALALTMQDNDILFVDECHTLVAGNRNRADWLLPFMTEGVLYGEMGVEEVPNIALFGATTEAGKMPKTLLDRFMCAPRIEYYSPDQGALIAGNLAARMRIDLPADLRPDIAAAADNNPRIMRKILTQYRDLAVGRRKVDLAKVFRWAGFTADGLPDMAVDMLMLLFAAKKNTLAIEHIQKMLGEPGSLGHYEQVLLQRGLIEVSGRGRALTDAGRMRAYAQRS